MKNGHTSLIHTEFSELVVLDQEKQTHCLIEDMNKAILIKFICIQKI